MEHCEVVGRDGGGRVTFSTIYMVMSLLVAKLDVTFPKLPGLIFEWLWSGSYFYLRWLHVCAYLIVVL